MGSGEAECRRGRGMADVVTNTLEKTISYSTSCFPGEKVSFPAAPWAVVDFQMSFRTLFRANSQCEMVAGTGGLSLLLRALCG